MDKTRRHDWQDKEHWGTNALVCSQCGLHIIDWPCPEAYKEDGALLVMLGGEKVPEGQKPIRWQTSNVLNVGFEGKTREQVIAYAEDEANRECGEPGKGETYVRWK